MQETEIKVKIPRKLHEFIKTLLVLYNKNEADFWQEEVMSMLESLVTNIEIPFTVCGKDNLKEIFSHYFTNC